MSAWRETPLWKHFMAVVTLGVGVQRVAVAFIVSEGLTAGPLILGALVQALAAMLIAFGLFVQVDGPLIAGVVIALITAAVLALSTSTTVAGAGALAALGLVLLGLQRVARHLEAEEAEDR